MDTAPVDGWIGVDLDHTLAHFEDFETNGVEIGKPNPLMVERVKRWLAEGIEVRIFTARAASTSRNRLRDILLIGDWCQKHIGQRLKVTAEKEFGCISIWDNIAVGVESNLGFAEHETPMDPLTPEEELLLAYDHGLLPTDQQWI